MSAGLKTCFKLVMVSLVSIFGKLALLTSPKKFRQVDFHANSIAGLAYVVSVGFNGSREKCKEREKKN